MMNQKNIVLIISAIAIIAIIAFGSGLYSVTSGTTVLSVDAPNIQSDDINLKNLNWLVLTRLGGSDDIQIKLSPEDFERLGGETTKNTWTATASAIEETLEYRINLKDDFRLYDYQVSEIVGENDFCGNDVIQTFTLERPLISDKKFCVSREFVGRYGTLSEPTNKIRAQLSVSNGQTKVERTITSDVGSVDFTLGGETIATATWQGSLVTGNANPDVPEIAVIGANTGDTWDFISRTKLTTYQNAQEDFERVVDTQTKTVWSTFSPDGFEELQQELMSESNNLDSDRSRTIYRAESIDSSFNLINADSTSNALLRFNPDYTLSNPLVTWWIRADYLGVNRRSGIPDIISVKSNEFGNEEQGSVIVEVLNRGDSSTFIASLQNCNDFKQTQTSNEFFAEGGKETTTALYVDAGSTNNDLSESCEVRVFDRASPSNDDVKPVDLSFSATKVCTPGNYFAQKDTIYLCDEDGLGSTAVEDCEDGDIKFTGEGDFGGYECVTDDIVKCTGDDCEDGDFNILFFLTALVVAGFAAAYTYNSTRPLAETGSTGKVIQVVLTIVVLIGVLLLVGWIVSSIVGGIKGLFSFSLW